MRVQMLLFLVLTFLMAHGQARSKRPKNFDQYPNFNIDTVAMVNAFQSLEEALHFIKILKGNAKPIENWMARNKVNKSDKLPEAIISKDGKSFRFKGSKVALDSRNFLTSKGIKLGEKTLTVGEVSQPGFVEKIVKIVQENTSKDFSKKTPAAFKLIPEADAQEKRLSENLGRWVVGAAVPIVIAASVVLTVAVAAVSTGIVAKIIFVGSAVIIATATREAALTYNGALKRAEKDLRIECIDGVLYLEKDYRSKKALSSRDLTPLDNIGHPLLHFPVVNVSYLNVSFTERFLRERHCGAKKTAIEKIEGDARKYWKTVKAHTEKPRSYFKGLWNKFNRNDTEPSSAQ